MALPTAAPEQPAAPEGGERLAPLLAERPAPSREEAAPTPEPPVEVAEVLAASPAEMVVPDDLAAEDLAMLFMQDELEDLGVIANLELLERLLELEQEAG